MGFYYNIFRFYDFDVGWFINYDLIGLLGGDNLYVYVFNFIGWIDLWGWFGEKLLNFLDVMKWFEKGGIVYVEVELGMWVYINVKGMVVCYLNGYFDFKLYEVRFVDVEGLKGNYSRVLVGDFGLVDVKVGSFVDYIKNIWYYYENMVMM